MPISHIKSAWIWFLALVADSSFLPADPRKQQIIMAQVVGLGPAAYMVDLYWIPVCWSQAQPLRLFWENEPAGGSCPCNPLLPALTSSIKKLGLWKMEWKDCFGDKKIWNLCSFSTQCVFHINFFEDPWYEWISEFFYTTVNLPLTSICHERLKCLSALVFPLTI